MSPGIRSGVNWTRLKSNRSAAASDRTSSVLATPGTPSSSTWPRHSSAITSPVIAGVLADDGLADLGAQFSSARSAIPPAAGGVRGG